MVAAADVTPLAGVWIEMVVVVPVVEAGRRHSPRGSVD